MLVFEAKLKGSKQQYEKLDEAIRTARFVRNSCLKYWMENRDIGRYELSAYCAILGQEFAWAGKLNSMARQAAAERAWSAIARFYDNCKKGKPGKKGYPRFKKHQTTGSVEYKTTGWSLSEERRRITFTDGFKAGTFKMWGNRDLHFYSLKQFKQVRVVRRADGYYVQFCIDYERRERREPTGKTIGLDVGLTHFYTDSDGQTVKNPRHLRKSEKSLQRLQRRLSKTKKGSQNRVKFIQKLARKHLKVSRQRKDFAVKAARCVVQCSSCGTVVKKALSVRTHVCHHCGHRQDRDWNAARNILLDGLRTVGHTGTLNASRDIDLCLSGETPLSKPSRGKRKPKERSLESPP
jgi:putative transposase